MSKRKKPAPKRAGADHEVRFARILRATGDDPASLLMLIAVMERIVADGRRRRRNRSR